jgi:hypothetical protein
MIGRKFWDFLGGNGTYTELIDVYHEVGRSFAERLRSLTEPAPDQTETQIQRVAPQRLAASLTGKANKRPL